MKRHTCGKRGKEACSPRHIREADPIRIVPDELRRVTHFARLKTLRASAANVEAFIEKAKRHTDLSDPTPELRRLFIQRIGVGERSAKYFHSVQQDIRIVCRDGEGMDKVKPVEIGEQEFGEPTEQTEGGQKTA